ncbi:MAG: hypothetical protein JNM56_06835 [Planctomycetia bacterium]|nr:hypothetical protein [Planctomycetia bacterium]
MNSPEPTPRPPDTAITGQPPLPGQAAITGAPPLGAGHGPDAIRSLAFLGRLKVVLQIYGEIKKRHPNPPLWGVMQAGFIILGLAVGYVAIEPVVRITGKEHLGGVIFLSAFLVSAALPDLLLKVIRRSQIAVIRLRLEDAIRLTVQTYPAEVEQCGGARILTDPVELEALVHVLENTYHAPPPHDAERWWTKK